MTASMNPLAGCTCLAIDPGPEMSGFVLVVQGRIVEHCAGILNDELISNMPLAPVVVESVECYGMAVGKSVFQTCYTIGRIMQVAGDRMMLVSRQTVRGHLCHSPKAKPSNIRAALLDKWGGKDVAIGRKANPGPLYGVKSHAWSALALAVTWWETRKDA